MGILSIIIVGFVVSSVDRLFFNTGLDTEFPDLSKLITKTAYEKKTDHKINYRFVKTKVQIQHFFARKAEAVERVCYEPWPKFAQLVSKNIWELTRLR